MAEVNGIERLGGSGTPQESMDESAKAATGVPVDASKNHKYGHIRLDITNSVLPLDKLSSTPSFKDGLPPDTEVQIRSLSCELIQLAGKLLKLPQVKSLPNNCSPVFLVCPRAPTTYLLLQLKERAGECGLK